MDFIEYKETCEMLLDAVALTAAGKDIPFKNIREWWAWREEINTEEHNYEHQI